MRTVKQLEVPQDTDSTKFPDGTIQNETDTAQGTPIVREIYGDVLTNIYAILRDSGITANGKEDSNSNGYQLLQSLKKFSNELNDIEQVVSLSGIEWKVNLNIDYLPNKYVFLARVTDNYTNGVKYNFSGLGKKTYPLTSSTGFKTSDTVLVTIDKENVRVVSFTNSKTTASNDLFPVFGTPLSYNSNDTLFYIEDGSLITDKPSVNNIKQYIQAKEGHGTLEVYQMFVISGSLLCFCYIEETQEYTFYQFDLNDLETPFKIQVVGLKLSLETNNDPYAYTDGKNVYLTNAGGTSANDYEIAKLVYKSEAKTLTYSSVLNISKRFKKTTNAVIHHDHLITFVNGSLNTYSLLTGKEKNKGYYNTILGVIFNYKDEIYYSNGEVAKKWNL